MLNDAASGAGVASISHRRHHLQPYLEMVNPRSRRAVRIRYIHSVRLIPSWSSIFFSVSFSASLCPSSLVSWLLFAINHNLIYYFAVEFSPRQRFRVKQRFASRWMIVIAIRWRIRWPRSENLIALNTWTIIQIESYTEVEIRS